MKISNLLLKGLLLMLFLVFQVLRNCFVLLNIFSLAHWDVNNANLHGSFYEDRLGDPNITMQMFIDVHKADPYAKLFLSDYAIIETRKSAQIATVSKTKLINVLKPITGHLWYLGGNY